ncbi:genetic interactor of prohibitins 3, mitochondrial [Naviculisporaceae sp. PSN 640]
MQMSHAGHNLSARWLGRVFDVKRCRASIVSQPPPTYLCPALLTPSRHASSFRQISASRRTVLPEGRHKLLYGPLNRIRRLHSQTAQAGLGETKSEPIPTEEQSETATLPVRDLPENCIGCGAYSQTAIPGEPGYYSLERKNVKEYMGLAPPEPKRRPKSQAENIVKQALEGLDLEKLAESGVYLKDMLPPETADSEDSAPAVVKTPLCDRCHDLKHNHKTDIELHHPELDDLMDTISASPYKYNHIYHVLDAADFPMSLLPKLRQILEMMPLRSQNRRSTGSKFFRGRKMELSFIITRSDLLGHNKETVDHLMPYLREVLRDALGRLGRNVRLGNVRCVSAKRNWWTTDLREEIFQRGGAGWMVGKVNVGKSALFAEVFPKGHTSATPLKHEIKVKIRGNELEEEPRNKLMPASERSPAESALLPATREEINFPEMPVHSPKPGTTAAPIRIPFGNGKGELIDLPGISRGDLSTHVREDKHHTLVMTTRVWPEEQSLPHGRSLLLGGFIRITPQTENLQFLAAAFVPLEAHAAQTSKCIAVQEQRDDAPNIENISRPGTGSLIKSAGKFALKYDVTMQRAGSVVRAMKQRRENGGPRAILDKLPFRVLGIDLLIEGVGWVEIVAQVRKKDFPTDPESVNAGGVSRQKAKAAEKKKEKEKEKNKNKTTWSENGLLQTLDLSDPDEVKPREEETLREEQEDGENFENDAEEGEKGSAEVKNEEDEDLWPIVEVFSPEGRFISSRRPMNAYMMNKPSDKRFAKRQRKSMKGVDKKRRMANKARQEV